MNGERIDMNLVPAWLRKLWDDWDIRVLVLASLSIQIILIYFGGRRKNIRGIWIEAVVWSTYLMADSAALFALGKLSDASSDDYLCKDKKGPNNSLLVLWSPLLLLHLGGPDTITAYSIEDVSLWLRHAFGVVLDAGLVVRLYDVSCGCSDLAIVWMCKHSKIPFVKRISQLIALLRLRHGKRWAGSLPTLNLLTLGLYETKPAMLQKVTKFFEMDEKFKAFMCQDNVYELEPLKLLIMENIRTLLDFFCCEDNRQKYFGKGDWRLNHLRKLGSSYTEKGFDITIVILHIATNYCYYLDDDNDSTKNPLREGSKLLSDYMMYLLVSHPYMLGNNVTAGDVSAILGSYVQPMEEAKKKGFSKVEIYQKIIELEPTVCTPNCSGNVDRSQLIEYGRIHIDACDLATIFKGKNNKWETISKVWVEMLFQGAADCEFRMHLQQLRRGGEFISQVWLLLYIHGLISEIPRDLLRTVIQDV